MASEVKRLYRSQRERMLGGVCGGLGEYIGMDPTVVRLIFVLLGFATGPGILLAYLILLLVVPEEPTSAPPASSS
jgi:phage shock protein C